MLRWLTWLASDASQSEPFRKPNHTSPRERKPSRLALQFEPLECRALLSISVAPSFTITNSWTSGYQAELKLTNNDAAGISPWRLEFDLAANITSIWNAQIASRQGNRYTIVGPSWNNTIAGNSSISFGLVASPTGTASAPTNYVLNGISLGGTQIAPRISISDVTLNEGNSGTTNGVFTVSLSAASTAPISVAYATLDGTAKNGSDYRAASGTLNFAAGQTSKTVSVAVLGDVDFESDEAFYLDLANVSGATIAKARGTGSIKNDDTQPTPPTPPAAGNFTFTVSSDWGSGFTSSVTMKNTSAAALNGWKLEFDFAGTITSIWDATIVSRTGNRYIVQHAGYNSSIAAGGIMSFGFNGTRASSMIVPTNFVLSGGTTTPGGGGNTGGNQAPVAAEDFASTAPGTAVVIKVLANDTDANGDALSIGSYTSPAHGTLVLLADNTFRYTPTAGYTGGDSFTYLLRDAQGATSTGKVTLTVAVPGAWPAQVFAPYVDMTLYPIYDLVSAAQTQGIRHFTLAFIVADSQKRPAWGGFSEYGLGTAYDTQLRGQIAAIRALGGDVIVSFGGAANQELAEVITDVTQLKQAYQQVIDAYGLTAIDFDIEGGAVAHRASVDRRNQAIALLQQDAAAAGRPLIVSYTLPVLPTGLTPDGLYVVQSAARLGANIAVVNVMAMDYGDSAAPNPQGKMGDYAIQAANSLFTQLKSVYTSKTDSQLWDMVGVTPMIGLNDVVTETFDQTEARELLAFAQQKGIGRLSFWSLNRDQQNPAGQLGYVDLKSSSIVQSPFEFSQIFKVFTG